MTIHGSVLHSSVCFGFVLWELTESRKDFTRVVAGGSLLAESGTTDRSKPNRDQGWCRVS